MTDSLPILQGLDFNQPPSPCFIVDRGKLEANGRLLQHIQQRTGAKILLALKGFALYGAFPYLRPYLAGTTSSGLHEALLAHEFFHKEIHVYSPAFKDDEINHLVRFADALSFNSPNQWRRFRPVVEACGRNIECGLRINPEYSEVTVDLYNPCAPGSRLGTRRDQIEESDLEGLTGLHFHTLCEQNSDALEHTLEAVEAKFGDWIDRMQWFNFGGGHHITRADYDVERLIRVIKAFQQRHPGVQVYLEPGEAIALGSGVLVATVLDIVHNEMPIAILDTSATAHMPDTLEMPYRADILGAGLPGEKAHTYRLGGLTCLAGDVIGDYAFDHPLKCGDRLVFLDMAHYTMVKTTTFNGVPHPAIALYHPDERRLEVLRQFGYEDYRRRLS